MARRRTRLACNYSHFLDELVRDGDVAVDAVKLEMAGQVEGALALGLPILLHGLIQDLYAGSRNLMDRLDRSALLDTARRTGTPYLSVHLGIAREDLPPGADSSAAAVIPRVAENLRALAAAVAPLPILVENLPWRLGQDRWLRFLAEPAAITAAVAEAGVGFLFDTGHARIAARGLGRSMGDYMADLPWDRCREIHTHGPALHSEGYLWDAHGPLTPADYAVLDEALARAPVVEAVSFEHGWLLPPLRDQSRREVLAKELPTLRAFLDSRCSGVV